MRASATDSERKRILLCTATCDGRVHRSGLQSVQGTGSWSVVVEE
jgi:hypothetical protein